MANIIQTSLYRSPYTERKVRTLVELTKLNDELILINPRQIEIVEMIPECKVIMMNGRYHIVKEDKETLNKKIIRFYNLCNNNNQL